MSKRTRKPVQKVEKAAAMPAASPGPSGTPTPGPLQATLNEAKVQLQRLVQEHEGLVRRREQQVAGLNQTDSELAQKVRQIDEARGIVRGLAVAEKKIAELEAAAAAEDSAEASATETEAEDSADD